MVTFPHLPRQSGESGRSPKNNLPTMYDLPSEHMDDPSRDHFHVLQAQLLRRTFQLPRYHHQNYFVGSNLYIYFDLNHIHWYKIPDWFLAVDVPRLYDQRYLRNSYVIWQERMAPRIVIELLLPGSEAEDLGRFYSRVLEDKGSEQAIYQTSASETTEIEVQETIPNKLEVYEKYLQVPHYFVYDRHIPQLRYFHLIDGQYQEQKVDSDTAQVWLADLEIGLGIWQGSFENAPAFWLRWCDRQGNWCLTDTEQERLGKEQERLVKEQAEQQTEQERLAKQQAEQQAEQECLAKEQPQSQLLNAAQNLLASGMAMEQVTALLNLSAEQIQWLKDLQN